MHSAKNFLADGLPSTFVKIVPREPNCGREMSNNGIAVRVEKVQSFRGHDGPVYAVEEIPGTDTFYSGSGDRIVAEWNSVTAGPARALVNVGAIVYSLLYLKEKNILLIGTSAGAIHVIDLETRRETRNIAFHKSSLFDLKFSTVHRKIFSASGDGSISVWSPDDFSLLFHLPLCKEKVRDLSLSPDQSRLAVACGDGSVRIFDTASMKELHRLQAHRLSANCVCFHPRGNYLLSGGRDAYLNVWDAENYQSVKSIPAHNYAIYAISFSPDEAWVATASRDKTVKIWSAENLEILQRIDKEKNDGHLNSVNTVRWLKNKLLLSAGDDRSISAWKISV